MKITSSHGAVALRYFQFEFGNPLLLFRFAALTVGFGEKGMRLQKSDYK